MRIFLIILSIIFFVLSGLITYKALEIPGYDFSYKMRPEPEPPVADEAVEQPAPQITQSDSQSGQTQIEELKATISKLEEKLSDSQKKMPEEVAPEKTENKAKVLAVLGGGTFDSGEVVINESLMTSVNDVINAINTSKEYRIVIEGHTDNIPIKATSSRHYQDNMDLSFLRANAIARILVEKGIARDRISVVGYGDTRPVSSNDTEEGRAKNRRVEIKLVPDDREL